MKKGLRLLMTCITISAYAQNTGINTTNPNATLEIAAKNTDGSTAEGILIPKLTGDAIKAMTANLDVEDDGLLVIATSAVSQADESTKNIKKKSTYRFSINSDGTNKTWVDLERGQLEKFTSSNGQYVGWKLYNSNNRNTSPYGVDLSFIPNDYLSLPNSFEVFGTMDDSFLDAYEYFTLITYYQALVSYTNIPDYIPPNINNMGINEDAGFAFNAGFANQLMGFSISNIAIGTGLLNRNLENDYKIENGVNINIGSFNANVYKDENQILNRHNTITLGNRNSNLNGIIIGSENFVNQSTAIGIDNDSRGVYSSTLGYRLRTTNRYEVAIGNSNVNFGKEDTVIPSKVQIFSLGNGNGIKRDSSNAITVLKNANTSIGNIPPPQKC